MRKLVLVVLVAFVVGGLVYAGGVNRERGIAPRATAGSFYGDCDLPGDASAAEGWDITPTSGNWGSKPEAQFAVVWEPNMNDTTELVGGRMAECTIPGASLMTPATVRINYLQGIANDDFCVFVNGAGGLKILVDCVDETNNSGETWADVDLALPPMAMGQDVVITIMATGNAWSAYSAYGQLGVDKITILD